MKPQRDRLVDRPKARAAICTPEARGLARDQVRLLVSGPNGHQHAIFRELADFLARGTLLVVNTSATLPASLPASARFGFSRSTCRPATPIDCGWRSRAGPRPSPVHFRSWPKRFLRLPAWQRASSHPIRSCRAYGLLRSTEASKWRWRTRVNRSAMAISSLRSPCFRPIRLSSRCAREAPRCRPPAARFRQRFSTICGGATSWSRPSNCRPAFQAWRLKMTRPVGHSIRSRFRCRQRRLLPSTWHADKGVRSSP